MTADARAWGLDSVTVRYGRHTALDQVTLHAVPGEVRALVGGDGAGKTTALRALAGALRPEEGEVRAPGRSRIGFMPTAAGVWRDLSVDENIAFAAAAHGVRGATLRERRAELLERAGLAAATDRLAGALSGGMRQKLAFFLAMLHRPDLLILDEPSTGVDPVSRVDLWRMISQAAADGAAVVMATTYLDEAERASHVLALDTGRVLIEGTPAQVLAAVPGHVTTLETPEVPAYAWRRGAAWRQWSPEAPASGDAPAADLEDAMVAAAFAKQASAEGEDSSRGAPAAPAPSDARRPRAVPSSVPAGRLGQQVGADAAPLIRATAVTRRFGEFTAVDDVSLTVRPGEIVGLLGANGAGKTTLIRMILGLLPASEGELELFGQVPSRHTRARQGYVPQGLGLWSALTARENLDFVDAVFGAGATALPEALAASGNRTVGQIGLGGQRQLAFAAALGHEPELLVLDEPTSGVDPLSRARLWDVIHERADHGVGVLVTTHYMQEAEQCDRLVLMSRGRNVAAGSRADIVGDVRALEVEVEQWPAAFRALSEAGLLVSLAGTRVRVIGSSAERVRDSLGAAGLRGTVSQVPATLEESMLEREAGVRI
ncbi:ATP-binding cassette domain-containing protein [Demequina sp. SO4-13]|uniref:ATP-binding cassette domain-containing protein n=1 Tax=Demequina sp. SO4-13 TaxID=3401027 RepID=UPI003AF9422A